MLKIKITRASLVMLLIFSLVLAACNESQTVSDSNGSSGNNTADGDKVLTIARGTDMDTFDIHDHNNTSTEAIHVNMFDYLVKMDRNQEPVPVLAESWETVEDTVWRFKLREGVTFHNGDPFTAEDVKFTVERVSKDETLIEHPSWAGVEEVNVVDEYTVDIITKHPDPIMLNRLSRIGSGMLPAQYIEENGWDHFLKNPVGTGPYKFVEWIRDDRLVLEKNNDYFDGEPKWDQVVFRRIPEDSTRVAELLTGGIDIAENVPVSDIERIENDESAEVIQSSIQRVMLLAVEMTEGPTADPKVREAIELAIDNEAITENILNGAAIPTRTRVTPGNFGANPELYETYLYDPERARELLREAGYEDGLEIHLSAPISRYPKDKEIAELIQGMLAEVGITVNLELLEWSTFSEKYKAEQNIDSLHMIAYGNSMFDASLAVRRLHSSEADGGTNYNNPEFDQLIEEAEFNMNLEEREKQYQKAQEMIVEDRPHIYLHQYKGIYGVSKQIEFEPRLDEMIYAEEVDLK